MSNARALLTTISAIAAASCALCHAQVRTDGSLGAAVAIAGPNFVIPQTLGRLSGPNLFFSFGTFSIGSGQSATFVTTTPSLANVVSRVTGGNVSVIDGPLRLQAAGGTPAFIFINPSGVIFGKGASIDVPGAFHVTTADYLRFADGRFYADPHSGSTLSAAAPEAFGFLGNSRTPIVVDNGANVAAHPFQLLSITAGDVQVSNANVLAPGGDLRIATTGDRPAEIGLTGSLPAAYGTLTLLNGAQVNSPNVDTHAGGTVSVSSGDITVVGSTLGSTAPYGSGANGGNVNVDATGHILVGPGGSITTSVDSSGHAGNISVTAESITLENGGIVSQNRQYAGGSGGNVEVNVHNGLVMLDGGFITADGQQGTVRVNAGDITIIDSRIGAQPTGNGATGSVLVTTRGNLSVLGGSITSTTYTDSDGGDVIVRVGGDLTMDNGSIDSNTAGGSGRGGSVSVYANNITIGNGGEISSNVQCCGTGRGGSVLVEARGTLTITDGGLISSTTTSDGYRIPGSSGSVHVAASSLTIDGVGKDFLTGISSSSLHFGGNAGSVEVSVRGPLIIINGGQISSETHSAGNAGNVHVTAGSLLVDSTGEADVNHPSQISTTALNGSTGNAGNIDVTVDSRLALLNGGVIASNAAGMAGGGSAGSINVSAQDIVIDSFLSDGYSGIAATAGPYSSGQAGSITVTAGRSLSMANHGFLTIENVATVTDPQSISPTTLSVSAPIIRLDSNAFISAQSFGNVPASNIDIAFGPLLYARSGDITTTAQDASGGLIRIHGDGVLVLRDSDIATSVLGTTGNGGDIDVAARALVMDNGFIQANTAASEASGGNVTIAVDGLVPSGRSLFVGGQQAFDFQPLYGLNVIQAAAPTGVSGTIAITSPVLDIASSITTLATNVIDTGGLARNLCESSGGSVLAQAGRGALPSSARGLLRAERSVAHAARGPLPPGVTLASISCR